MATKCRDKQNEEDKDDGLQWVIVSVPADDVDTINRSYPKDEERAEKLCCFIFEKWLGPLEEEKEVPKKKRGVLKKKKSLVAPDLKAEIRDWVISEHYSGVIAAVIEVASDHADFLYKSKSEKSAYAALLKELAKHLAGVIWWMEETFPEYEPAPKQGGPKQ